MGAINVADILTMQDLANGHLDVKALGEAANGDENTIVTTRTGNTYPSVKKAIKTLFENGGLPAIPFATKALMTASALVDGKYAVVTDDIANNGLYIKTAGVWVKSSYDPLAQSKTYTDSLKTEIYNNAGAIVLNQGAFINVGGFVASGDLDTIGLPAWKHTNNIAIRQGDVVDIRTLISAKNYPYILVYNSSGALIDKKLTNTTNSAHQDFQYTFTQDGFFKTQHSSNGTSGCRIVVNANKPVFALKSDLESLDVKMSDIEGYRVRDNLFNENTVNTGFLVNNLGNLVSNDNFPHVISSDYIEVDSNALYTLNFNDISDWITEYDKDKFFIKYTEGRASYNITTSPSTKFIRVNINKNVMPISDFIVAKGGTIPLLERKVDGFTWLDENISAALESAGATSSRSHNDMRFQGKNLLVTGDSITDSRNTRAEKWWHGYLKDWLDFGTVQNDGTSGSGLIKTGDNGVGLNYRLAEYAAKYTQPDVILIMNNMNDGTSGVTGAWDWIYGAGDAHKNDWTTVVTTSNMVDSLWYALRYMFEEMLRQYPDTPIGFITSTPRSQTATKSGTARTGYTTKCWGQDGWFAEWVDVIERVAGHYSIPVLDLYSQSNMRPQLAANNTLYFGDGIHPNTLGQEVIGQKIYEFVKQFV